ncbi:alpha/beta hydrolase [Methanosphaera sp. ISO3-F5]|uniref:alpha/beta fold hydrolase n=1 Tax=Methanosphaera sp. ISO3-F5 TaxID=1452353 RepID=UPI002B25C406|nr:alpha/beta hydrolase [Methanosphaera sp. ISO3-F5]WQH63281.1 alpha/beta hydrolase [Methanosphaera sp. ISO3-F5]
MFKKDINYKVEGKGKPLILIHGLSDSLEYWEPLSSILKNKHKIIRYDIRGHGKSPLSREEISIDLLVDDLNILLNNLKVDECIIVGFSMGGLIGLSYAIKYPEKVSSIILMSTFARCSSYVENIFLQLRNAVKSSYDDFYEYILPMVLCPNIIEENKKELEMIKEYASNNVNTMAIEKAINAMLGFDIIYDLDQFDIPTLILCGKYDTLVPPSLQEETHKKIINSEMIVLDNLKHNLLVGKNISKISDIIVDFILKQ